LVLNEDTVRAYIAVGANIDPHRNIMDALDILSTQISIHAVSTFYRTAPVNRPEQSDFLNGVVAVDTDVGALALKKRILRPLEKKMGRTRSSDRYAARTLDLDLILYGETVVTNEELVLPDPDIRLRVFVAQPLFEVAPDARLPDTGEALAKLAVLSEQVGLTPDWELTRGVKERLGL
jgi:2-amino-4-hydroxy-6-hydroxymethyldihydropteridine diphosphokinase